MSKHLSDISVQSITRRISYLVRSCFTHTSGGKTGALVISSPTSLKQKQENRGLEDSSLQTIRIPFSILERCLPEEAKALVTQQAIGTAIELPKNLVLDRLASGTFRMTLGELYRFAKEPGTPAPTSEHLQLEIPLKEILSLVNPEDLPRKKPRKRIIPPLDIPAPFQPSLKSPKIQDVAPKAGPNPTTTAPLNVSHRTLQVEAGSIEANHHSEAPHRPVPDSINAVKSRDRANTQPFTPETPAIGPANFGSASRPAAPFSTEVANITPPPIDEFATGTDGYTVFSLQELWDAWPTEVKTEALLQHKDVLVYIPDTFLQVELKKGRLLCTTDTLKGWIRDPKAQRAIPSSTQLTLELPLKAVVPAFIKKTGHTRQPPRSFGATPATRPVTHYEPHTPELRTDTLIRQARHSVDENSALRISTSPRPESTVTIAPPQSAMRKPDPASLIAQALTLPGVAGAILALPNGVIGAQKLPRELNPDAVAEFVHRAMDQINQCATVLRQGYITRLSFTIGEISWAIFKRGAIYFAVVSKPNQMLPEEALGLLAAELESIRQPNNNHGNPEPRNKRVAA